MAHKIEGLSPICDCPSAGHPKEDEWRMWTHSCSRGRGGLPLDLDVRSGEFLIEDPVEGLLL